MRRQSRLRVEWRLCPRISGEIERDVVEPRLTDTHPADDVSVQLAERRCFLRCRGGVGESHVEGIVHDATGENRSVVQYVVWPR